MGRRSGLSAVTVHGYYRVTTRPDYAVRMHSFSFRCGATSLIAAPAGNPDGLQRRTAAAPTPPTPPTPRPHRLRSAGPHRRSRPSEPGRMGRETSDPGLGSYARIRVRDRQHVPYTSHQGMERPRPAAEQSAMQVHETSYVGAISDRISHWAYLV